MMFPQAAPVANPMTFPSELYRFQTFCDKHINPVLEQMFVAPHPDMQRLYQAMRYSVMNGGKRVRPLLVMASCLALEGQAQDAIAPACAVELIHAYSLVHDDLPAMDDDNLRRGQPTTHIAFDEASAILAGDALQTLAFEVLSDDKLAPADDSNRLQMIRLLARASGAAGMVGGQAIDLAATGQRVDQSHLERMHRHKTGALISASVQLGALASGRADDRALAALTRYADAIGLAFQVQDDILDVVSNTETLGKQQGSDLQHDKSTYPALLGLEQARTYAGQLRNDALQALEVFDDKADILRQLADYIVQRSH